MSIWSGFTLDKLKAFRDTLARAMVSGTLMVRFDNRQTQYRSLDEMRRVASELEEEIASREGKSRVRQIRVNSSKGFGC